MVIITVSFQCGIMRLSYKHMITPIGSLIYLQLDFPIVCGIVKLGCW